MDGILRFGVVFTPEIAQFPLGDLNFKVQTPHYKYSSVLVKYIMGDPSQDFDTGTHLSGFYFYVTIALMRL